MRSVLFCLSYFRTSRNILPIIEFLSKNSDYNLNLFLYRQLGSHTISYNVDYDDVKILHKKLNSLNARLFHCLEPYSENKDYLSKSLKKYFLNKNFDFVFFDEANIKISWHSLIISKFFRKKNTIRIAFQEGSTDHNGDNFLSMSCGLGFMYDYLYLIGKIDVNAAIKINKNLRGRCFAIGIPLYDTYRELMSTNNKKDCLLLITSFTEESGKSQIFEPLKSDHLKKSGILNYIQKNKMKLLIKEKIKKHSNKLAFDHLNSTNIKSTFDDVLFYNSLSKIKFSIGAPSTLQLLLLFLNIPTFIISKPYSGRLSNFSEYRYLLDLNSFVLDNKFLNSFDINYQKNFSRNLLGNINESSVSIFEKHLNNDFDCAFKINLNSYLIFFRNNSIQKSLYLISPYFFKKIQTLKNGIKKIL